MGPYSPVVLASASPRRSALLSQVGVPHTVVPSGIDENVSAGADIDAEIERIAREKALHVASSGTLAAEYRAVIGADTAVVVDGEALGKPADGSEAAAMLRRLSGRVHRVVTGVAIVWADGPGRVESWSEATEVEFRELQAVEIDAYVRSGRPLDKAGAYGIQEDAAAFVSRIDGCYFNVVGLPLGRLCARLLQASGRPDQAET